MADLVDTNVLVYRCDGRFPEKQRRATALLRQGIEDGSLRVAHQAVVEFMAAVTRSVAGPPILSPEDARREAEEILIDHTVLYPSEEILRIALWGTAAYGLSWFDAHMWSYAEFYGLPVIWTEDFEHGRQYGTVRAMDPFLS